MELTTTSQQARLMGLIDAAVCPPKVVPLLERAGVPYLSVFAGLPEEDLGPASLFLVSVSDTEADWFAELERLDLQRPCLSLIWSRAEMDAIVTHLQAFLFADIGDNMSAMVRFFDPRNTGAVFDIWGEQLRAMFMGPFEQWAYRGRNREWTHIQNESALSPRICRSVVVQLAQADVDALTAHTEPDEILASLIEGGNVDGERPYLERFDDFVPRYIRAVEWGIREPGDRLLFCLHSYLYAENFDQHPVVNELLSERQQSDEPFCIAITRVPVDVWQDIKQMSAREAMIAQQSMT
jgi:hypothetical protein